MCGIAGIYEPGGPPVSRATLGAMAAAIMHRGPDADGFFADGALGFAHRHLRIIDLSDAALQPMRSTDGRISLIHNGEIYNYVELRPELEALGYRFHSASDTEVVVNAYRAWGLDCFRRFNGMWACALWDTDARRLVLSRDRMGVKPLYYRWDGRKLIFGSEIKALLAHPEVPAQPNRQAIAEYFAAMYTGGDQTWFRGIHKLLPGHYLVLDDQGLRIEAYWRLPEAEDEPGARSEASYAAEVRALLEDSIRLRLRSDVPLGSHLSGGVDSSAIVALASRSLEHPLMTFSGAFAEGAEYDERPYIHAVARMYGTDHHEVVPTANGLRDVFDRLVWHLDEPVAGPGAFPQYCVCWLTKRSGVTVVNGGQGGDELFGGYYGYIPPYLRGVLAGARHDPRLAGELLRDLAVMAGRPALRRSALAALRSGRRGRLDVTGHDPLPAFFGPGLRDLAVDSAARREPVDLDSAGRSPLGNALARDLRLYLPALLQVEDRTSMAWSLESRVPLLDYRLVELAMRIPATVKLRGLETKRVLRRAVGDLLPPVVAARRDKKGFPTPIGPWFAGPLYGWARERLLGEAAAQRQLFDQQYVSGLLAEHQGGQADHSRRLWMLLNVSAWFDLFIEHKPTASRTDRQLAGVMRDT